MKTNRILISQDTNSQDIVATRYLPIVEIQADGEVIFSRSELENSRGLSILKQEILPGECWEYELVKKERVR